MSLMFARIILTFSILVYNLDAFIPKRCFNVPSYRCNNIHMISTSTKSTNTASKIVPITPLYTVPELPVSVEVRTEYCLDFQFVLESLKNSCITALGKEIVCSRYSDNPEVISKNYEMVDQLTFQLGLLPLRSKMDVWGILKSIDAGGAPEREELSNFAQIIEEVKELSKFLKDNSDKLHLFQDLASQMVLPEPLVDLFENAFDEENNLNGTKFPIIGKLRLQCDLLRTKIIQSLQSILRSPNMKDKIADSGYVEVEGRFCILLINTYKKGVGIVHGTSNSGKTFYVEPLEIVEPTNELKTAMNALLLEENKIFFEMCKVIAAHRDDIKSSLTAVADVDILRAKAKLGLSINGIIPEVGNEGSLRCRDARHPVLALRGAPTVGNDLTLSQDAVALVISGPNAGGKTVVLKTAGLFCLMVKHSLPIPARSGARVDVMQVMADIGDMQSVSGDLSTFSGHLVICREMLRKAREFPGSSLVLLDEIGTGTDPAQGAALAQSILEELINVNARVIVTTHYQRIKEIAAMDDRFRIAAMEFVDNKPTYRLKMGFIGESYALEAGRRMGIPTHVLERANSLLDNESRIILGLQKKLEEETEIARKVQEELKDKIAQLESREQKIEEDRKEIELQIEKIKNGQTEEYLEELRRKEVKLENMIRETQELLMQEELSRSDRDKIVEEVKVAIRTERLQTELTVVERDAKDIAIPLTPGEPIEENEVLIILERGGLFGCKGVVTRRNKGRGRVQLRVAGAEIKIERHLVGLPLKKGIIAGVSSDGSVDESEMSAKDKRMLQMLREELVDPDKMLIGSRKSKEKLSGIRLSSNTLDLRGFAVTEAQAKTTEYLQSYIEDQSVDSLGVIYLHHGNKKDGDLVKPKLRAWLKRHPLVRRLGPAQLSEGGDAFTMVELHLDDDAG